MNVILIYILRFLNSKNTMSVIHITREDQYLDYMGMEDTLVVVKFSADWCGPCKRIAPAFEQLAQENPSVKFLHVDVDVDMDECKTVSGLPTFRFYRDTRLLDQFAGASTAALKDKRFVGLADKQDISNT